MSNPWAGPSGVDPPPASPPAPSTMGSLPPLPPPPPSRLSRTSIAAAVLGLTWLGGLGSLLAVTFGIIGLKETDDPSRHGRPLAWAGIALGVVGIFATMAVVVPLGHGRGHTVSRAVDDRCARELRAVDRAYATFTTAHGGLPPQTMADLTQAGLLAHATVLYTVEADGVTGEGVVGLSPLGQSLGCPSPTDAQAETTATSPTATATATPTTTTVPTSSTDAIGGADAAACASDLATLMQEADDYVTLNGSVPTSLSQIDGGQSIPWYTLGPDNAGTHLQLVRTARGVAADCPVPPSS